MTAAAAAAAASKASGYPASFTSLMSGSGMFSSAAVRPPVDASGSRFQSVHYTVARVLLH